VKTPPVELQRDNNGWAPAGFATYQIGAMEFVVSMGDTDRSLANDGMETLI
jgi:hypothetical protein